VKKFVQNQLPALVWIGIIFWLSSLHRIPNIHIPMADKIAHCCFYFVLCGFSYRAFLLQEKFPGLQRCALSTAVVFTILYGITDELHQLFVWGRTSDILDVSVDALGALLFAILLRIYQKRRARDVASPGSQATV
jgi:VanZ family protein